MRLRQADRRDTILSARSGIQQGFVELPRGTLLPYNLQFFAKEGPGGEKTEEPTSKRLNDARKKGQVAKSKEIATGFTLLAFFITIRVMWRWLGTGFEAWFHFVYNKIPDLAQLPEGQLPMAGIHTLYTQTIIRMIIMMLPFLLVGFVVSFICGIVQVGWKWTFEPMKPKLSKMNPISGMKKIFSLESIFNLLLSVVKIALICIIVYAYWSGSEDSIFLLYGMPLSQGILRMGSDLIEMGIRVSVVYMIVAAMDFIYQKRKFHEEMKMTKQEVKDEMKDSEGDPQIKGKQRQRMREASMRRMMQQLPQADVVITNPTRYAVALQYIEGVHTAPVVLAKGKDHLAGRIKDVAAENDIEIVENKPLARMLYANVEIGEMVPPELYRAVAEVLAYVYQLKGRL